ncbi:MAG: 16S rRNA (adenine(1518)-N(6)/adenine(1519)-N(6))-dimethyltransferase RsmA [Pseudomonadota bacterium]
MNRHRPRKRFGQHFLTDPGAIGAIVDAIAPTDGDTMVEIGPGPGAITTPLAKRVQTLDIVELDRDLAARLRDTYASDDHVTVHEADALKFDFATLGSDLRIVGNLPYNISTPLLFHLLEQRHAIRDMHFMLQKEVVERMAAEPGSKAYGRLSVMLGCYLDIEALFDVGPESFEPPPAVTSAVVRLRPIPAAEAPVVDNARLSTLVAAAFSQRRKTLRNALSKVATEEDLDALGIDAGLRPENVGIDDWIALANRLAAQ